MISDTRIIADPLEPAMHPPGADTVLVRYGDIGVKSDSVQARMERRLTDNVGAMLESRRVDATVERTWTRILVRAPDESTVEAATAAVTDVFGVVSASPAATVDPELEPILEVLAETARARYEGGTFAVRGRRAGERDAHDFTSADVEREGGNAVWTAVEGRFEPEVDLDDPDWAVHVEVREDEAFVFTESVPGPGGLPLGVGDPVVALVSGGIDSPVAAWEVMKRGCPVVPVYFDFGIFGGVDHQARVVETVSTLQDYAPGFDLTLRAIPAGEAAELLVESVGKTRMLSLRRFMLRAATAIAEEVGARALVTGEALGQKSSQTVSNLATTDPATELPVLRPLLTRDKQEIIAQAREIDTYHDSTIPAGCNRIAPDYPETRARIEQVHAAEPDDLLAMAADAAADAYVLENVPAAAPTGDE